MQNNVCMMHMLRAFHYNLFYTAYNQQFAISLTCTLVPNVKDKYCIPTGHTVLLPQKISGKGGKCSLM